MIDAHLHLCDASLFPQAEEIIKEAQKNRIDQFLNVVTCEEELEKGLMLKKKFKCVKIAASTTPHDAAQIQDGFFSRVAEEARKGTIDAIGETGLEYFHQGLDKNLQKQYLIQYLNLACETSLPLVFHCRDAFDDLFEILKPYKGKIRGMVHCFTGSYEDAMKSIDMGLHVSISGIVTYKNSTSLQTAVAKLPLSSILIETDSPYLSPLTQRGKTNRPFFIKETYQKVAQIKNISLEELERHVTANFSRLF